MCYGIRLKYDISGHSGLKHHTPPHYCVRYSFIITKKLSYLPRSGLITQGQVRVHDSKFGNWSRTHLARMQYWPQPIYRFQPHVVWYNTQETLFIYISLCKVISVYHWVQCPSPEIKRVWVKVRSRGKVTFSRTEGSHQPMTYLALQWSTVFILYTQSLNNAVHLVLPNLKCLSQC